MKRIYKVNYGAKWSFDHDEWIDESVTVLERDAERAIEKVRRAALAQSEKDDAGKRHKVLLFQLKGVELLAEAQL